MLSDLGRKEITSEIYEIEKNVVLALKQTDLLIWEEISFKNDVSNYSTDTAEILLQILVNCK